MKSIYILFVFVSSLFATDIKVKYVAEVIPKNMSVKTKKERFYHLLVPVVEKVHTDLMREYEGVVEDIKEQKNQHKISQLKIFYKAKTDSELLAALKPHPKSIVLAQAAIESSWGTSRFFKEAYNIFGMWSVNPNEPRIAAGEKRGGVRTIWLKKFDSIEESVRAYYKLMAKGKAFKEFRTLRVATDDPHELVKKLDKYSEIGEEYTKILSEMIRYNKLERYN